MLCTLLYFILTAAPGDLCVYLFTLKESNLEAWGKKNVPDVNQQNRSETRVSLELGTLSLAFHCALCQEEALASVE